MSTNVDIIQLLLSKGASVNFQDNTGGTALVYAVNDRSLEAVKLLLEKNARVDIGTDRFGTPPLHFAVSDCLLFPASREIAKLLLERGAPVELQDSQKQTALIIACSIGNLELLKLLLQKGAKIDYLDNEGGYALLYAVRYAIQRRNLEVKNFEIIELLLEKGAKANIKADNGESALGIIEKNAAFTLVSVCLHVHLYTSI